MELGSKPPVVMTRAHSPGSASDMSLYANGGPTDFIACVHERFENQYEYEDDPGFDSSRCSGYDPTTSLPPSKEHLTYKDENDKDAIFEQARCRCTILRHKVLRTTFLHSTSILDPRHWPNLNEISKRSLQSWKKDLFNNTSSQLHTYNTAVLAFEHYIRAFTSASGPSPHNTVSTADYVSGYMDVLTAVVALMRVHADALDAVATLRCFLADLLALFPLGVGLREGIEGPFARLRGEVEGVKGGIWKEVGRGDGLVRRVRFAKTRYENVKFEVRRLMGWVEECLGAVPEGWEGDREACYVV